MKNFKMVFIVCLALLVISCSSVSVKTDYDREEDFSQYKTFDFIPLPSDVKVSGMTVNRIKDAVTSDLQTKGFQLSSSNPDLLIALHTDVKDKVNVTNWGYGYAPRGRYRRGGGYWGGGGGIDVHQYEAGTLIIDVIKANEKEMIWRGVGEKAMSSTSDPEKKEKNIAKVITKIMEEFPPTS